MLNTIATIAKKIAVATLFVLAIGGLYALYHYEIVGKSFMVSCGIVLVAICLLWSLYKLLPKGDIFINEFMWSFGVRPLLCGLVGTTAASIIWMIIEGLTRAGMFNYNFISFWLWLGTTVIIMFLLSQNEEDEKGTDIIEIVPGTEFGAVVTWRGMIVSFWGRNVIRTTGEYYWTGKSLRLGRTTKTDPTFTDKDPTKVTKGGGFINLGKIPLQIWNNPTDKETDAKRTIINATSQNLASVTGSMTLNLVVVKPFKTLNTDDATLKIADRARQEYRELIELFVDSDVVRLMKHMEDIMCGKRVVTCFLPNSVGMEKTGSMIRDRGGRAMLHVIDIPSGEDEATIETLTNAAMMTFAEEVKLKANVKQLGAVQYEVAGVKTVHVSVVYVSGPITDMIEAIGCELENISFGDLSISEVATKAANQASAEMKEREAELEDALTRVTNRQVLLPTKEELANPGFELAQILESQRSGNKQAQVVYAAGTNNPLVAPAVAAASIIQGKQT